MFVKRCVDLTWTCSLFDSKDWYCSNLIEIFIALTYRARFHQLNHSDSVKRRNSIVHVFKIFQISKFLNWKIKCTHWSTGKTKQKKKTLSISFLFIMYKPSRREFNKSECRTLIQHAQCLLLWLFYVEAWKRRFILTRNSI